MLTLHQSNRLEHLARRLADLLGRPVGDPLQPEWVVVQHPGMARWLSLELAASIGIAANIEFPLPAVFIWRVFRQLLGEVPERDRYQPNVLAWRIHALLSRDEPGIFRQSPLSAYLESGDELRAFQLSRELATLFDRYLLYRPDWILAWERGESAVDGDEWQAALWRALSETERSHWVALQQRFFSLSSDGGLSDLPRRVFLFGVPTLSPGYLQLLHQLAEVLDLHLLLLNPCATHWADIVAPQTQARLELESPAEALYLDVGHPLLASMGRQGRDFFAAINELDPGSEELFEPAAPETLLASLQNQILDLQTPTRGALADPSIALHLCHSPMREVEVLYDQLLAMFEEMPGLSANEILVMAPEIDRYSPLIEALFGEPGDRPPIPFRISDRQLLQRNPLAAALLELLELPGSRYTITQVLSLLEQPAIQRRFGLHETSMETITHWLTASGIRWGRDGPSKRAWGLPPDAGNSWQFGLRRLLLGYAMPRESDALWRGILPLDAAEGSEAEVLGGLLAFCDQLCGLEEALAASRPVAEWRDSLFSLIEAFFYADGEAGEQEEEVRAIIRQLAEEVEEAGFEEPLSLTVIRARLQTLLAGADERGFLGGGITCCALAPMRSLPFRVICLLGMNDGVFPRQQTNTGFDLMTGRFRFGDRSRRMDDRYLFLETLISARERLYISYLGHSQRDNSPLPPAVVVDELCDTLRRMVGEEGLAQLTHQHPLQPFSTSYFEEDPGLFSYSQQRREASMRVGLGRRRQTHLVTTPLPQRELPASVEVSLDRLIDFFTNPPRGFARERLQLNLEAVAELPDEREPFELDRFERLDDERRMVEAMLEGVPADALLERLAASGRLPHGQIGQLAFQRMRQRAEAMTVRLRPLLAEGEVSACGIDLRLARGRLGGRLDNLRPMGRLVFTTDNRFYPHQLLRHWIEHLVLNLARPPGIAPETHLLEGEKSGRMRPVEQAEGVLDELLGLYQEGQERPLAFYPATAKAYVEGLSGGDREKALEKARSQWYGNHYRGGDAEKPYNRLLWPDGECLTPEFGRLAETIMGPLLAHLEGL